jgi:hypothetical protein
MRAAEEGTVWGNGEGEAARDDSSESLAGDVNMDDAGLAAVLTEMLMGEAADDSREAAAVGEEVLAEVATLTNAKACVGAGEVGELPAALLPAAPGAEADAENESRRCFADALPPLAPLSLSLEPDPDSAGTVATACCRCPRSAESKGDATEGDASGELDEVRMDVSTLAGVVGLSSSACVREGDGAAMGDRAIGAEARAGVRRAAAAGDAAADPGEPGEPSTCKPEGRTLFLLLPLLLLSLSKLASISSEMLSSTSLPGGGDTSSPMRNKLPDADSGAARGAASGAREGEGDAAADPAKLTGMKPREVFGDGLGDSDWLRCADDGDAAPEVSESKEEVAAW